MQVDHAKPLRIGGEDDISNYLPACRSCNHYKATLDIEGFRDYLSKIHNRLMRDSIPYAYDVDKVVEQLREQQEKLETDIFARESDNWYGQYCNGIHEGIDKAIEIVKAGGVE